MSPTSPEPDPKRPDDASPNEAEDKVVETFSFDVSAGNRAASDEPQATEPAEPIPRSAPSGKPSARRTTAKRRSTGPNRDTPSTRPEPQDAPTKKLPLAAVRVLEQPLDVAETDPPKKSRRSLPSLTVSLALHAVVLLLLSFYTLATLTEEEDLGLYASTAPYEEVDDFQEIDIDPSEDLESEMVSELTDPGEAAFGDLSAESALSDVTGDTLTSDSLGDLGNLFGDTGDGLADAGPGGAATASFFGTKVQGKRIVFILDNSGDMQYGRLETVISELIKTVRALTTKQRFYVIFHSDTVYPLYYPQPATKFVLATDRNKERLEAWLKTVELCYGDSVDEAMIAAASIRPDVVYLLSNGIMSEKKFDFLRSGGDGSFPIHTVGVGLGKSTKARKKLQEIAVGNGGTFRSAEVPAKMTELAREKDRPYHRDGPGETWGRKVKVKIRK